MTFAEAILDLEQTFVVHHDAGYPDGEYDGPLDMTLAPNGEPYVVVSGDGILDENERVRCWYSDEEFAIECWLHAAKHYATSGPRKGATHLYWRDKPAFVGAEFVALNQAAALQDPRLRDSINIEVGYVYSRLLVSRLNPDGKDDSDV